ncbi:MAG: hypothetical protein DKM23_04275 [Candidatus Melainabacteria bacterium]|nr:MAG: hypothetical protein DKM23_04275 [Candidatus Melainabacteria bacterium]
MKKQAFTLVEIIVVISIVVLTAIILIPNIIDDNKKLHTISQWKHTYKNIEYVFSAIKAQSTETDKVAIEKTRTNDEREVVLCDLLNPYFRMQSVVDPKTYKTYFMDGSFVNEKSEYYVKNLHTTNSGMVIGVKWLLVPSQAQNSLPIAMITIDLNGLKKPNKWGHDIFGVNIFVDRIEPFGEEYDEMLMKSDCSKKGKGISCASYYNNYGGRLN